MYEQLNAIIYFDIVEYMLEPHAYKYWWNWWDILSVLANLISLEFVTIFRYALFVWICTFWIVQNVQLLEKRNTEAPPLT